ncbi:4'-phosphopantetheinyl transferase superfamily protein [Mucilaginibacter achroorhodeus]|uniref:4'-phosphopantetheinyl transferase superfamily protein n=1 Tax=Mucilaginibacter achroorhodeus TaxID=2599294 RepID=A0A563U751_9SPHI|nr:MULTISPECIES: 4'-phosphopantetheinyl transferase superfamily protein [Mucilaginibacter]QXV65026.1 4'-phosphopantetheinyl transferase superfamily protein [Mucilaginibacter sp. 21P]TWR27176.1 4'-phosphopantetheinyl transferase superfamily protein [Mucilaginibacter achroorhodeus]
MGQLTNIFIEQVIWLSQADFKLPGSREAHLWRINIPENLYRLNELRAILQPDELQRAEKYHQLKDRQRFVVSRALQRMILGKYLDQDPEALRFVLGDNKKPYLLKDDGTAVHYNVSHSGDWIALAIASSPVGADVEFIDPEFPFDDILPDHFSETEIDFIKLNESTQRFYLLWTRKEAFLKATGQGLGEHLIITPALDGAHELADALSGNANNWKLQSLVLSNNYLCAVAMAGEWELKSFVVNFR